MQNGVSSYFTTELVASYDYYPFGSPVETHESNNGYRYGFNGAEKEDQISGKGINYDLGLRFYDSRVARMFSVDPRTPEYPWQSPYVYHRNSPIKTIDYLGGGDTDGLAHGTYRYEGGQTQAYEHGFAVDDEGNRLDSDDEAEALTEDFLLNWANMTYVEPGGGSVASKELGLTFQHEYKNSEGKTGTLVTDVETGARTFMGGGTGTKNHISGEKRGAEIGWWKVYREWETGTGPEYSLFEGSHPAISEIKKHYLYQDKLKEFKNSGKDKKAYDVNFWYWIDMSGSGANMQAQMMGSYIVSFYNVGKKTLVFIQDSKSQTSFYYHLPIENRSREEGNGFRNHRDCRGCPYSQKKILQETNTYQTYLFWAE